MTSRGSEILETAQKLPIMGEKIVDQKFGLPAIFAHFCPIFAPPQAENPLPSMIGLFVLKWRRPLEEWAGKFTALG